MQVYDLTTGREASDLTHANLSGIVFSPDSRWMFTNGRDGAVKWQIDGFEEVIGLAHPEYPWNTVEFRFSPDGRLLATGDPSENKVKVWETGAGQLLYDLDRFAIREVVPGRAWCMEALRRAGSAPTASGWRCRFLIWIWLHQVMAKKWWESIIWPPGS